MLPDNALPSAAIESDQELPPNMGKALLTLPEFERKVLNWIRRHENCKLADIATQLEQPEATIQAVVKRCEKLGLVQSRLVEGDLQYRVTPIPAGDRPKTGFIDTLEKVIARIKFSTLVILTLISALLLVPFVLSPWYLDIWRDTSFEVYNIFQGERYKLITGYTSLVFVLFEIVLTARKRGRRWFIAIKIPGSIHLWRSLHILTGVLLLGTTLVHTMGSRGLNFNAYFLWVFMGVILSALVGSVAELGVLESPLRYFGSAPGQSSWIPSIAKAPLIRNLRMIWLATHIFLVNLFCIMLGFHIFLAYYYQ